MGRVRTRQHYTAVNGFSYRSVNNVKIQGYTQLGGAVTSISTCYDDVGRGIDHPVFIEHVDIVSTPVNGRSGNYPVSYREYKNYDMHTGRSWVAHLDTSPPSEGASMSTAMAKTNPSRPVVSIPTFLGEMKDFPRMIRQAGNVALKLKKKARILKRNKKLKAAADTYLAYKFAINPLISDLQKLMNFQASAEQRMEELDRLYSKGGMRRRVNVFSGTVTAENSLVLDSALSIIISCKIDTMTTCRRWATLRWTPTSPRPFKNDKEKQALAQSLVFGLNFHSLTVTAWELLPWSWMIDWFTNTQDYLESNNNTVPASAGGRCVMTNYETTAAYRRNDANITAFRGGEALYTKSTKIRSVGVANTIGAHFPLFSESQLSILGALSVSKGHR